MRKAPIILLLALPLLVACGAEEPGGDEESSVPAEIESMNLPPELEVAVREATKELAARVEVGPETIDVEAAEFVQWPSSALGCPEPGMMYTQALVPGYRVLLRAGDDLHHYHGARGEPPFPCPSGRAEKPAETGPDSSADVR
ncbi:MAG: hypothetical protein ACNS61_12105 [Candidatus Wenzhouxiangella sp. M2_3B_020]